MARFEVEVNGQRYEVDAPDVDTALAAIGGMTEGTQDKYGSALEDVRRTQFPQMDDQRWAEYSQLAFPPADFQDTAQASQLFGFGDELNAGLGALGSQIRQWTGGGGPGFGEAYEQYSELEQARRDLGRENMGGVAAGAADVVGGLSIFGPAQSSVAAALAGTPLTAATPVSLAQTAANSTIGGAAFGGLAGFGTADENRFDAAAQGAGAGAAVGYFAPLLTNAAASGVRNVLNSGARNQAARQMGIDPNVARFMQQTLGADDSLSASGMARMQAAGGEAMLADAGQGARNMLNTAIQSSGSAGRVATQNIGARVSRDAQAIQSALDNALGTPQGVQTTRAQIAADSSGARSSAYDAAYNSPIDYSSEHGRTLEGILRNRVDQSVINSANAMMRRDGTPSRQIMAQIGEDGAVTYQTMPDIRQIDYITRALNDQAQANAGLGALGGQTAEGRSFQNLSSDLRGTARQAVPEYDAALQTAADPIRRSQAVQFGSEVLRPSTTREAVAERVASMTQPELQAVAQGVRSQLDDTLANVTRAVTDGNMEAREAIAALRQLSSRSAREKLSLVIGEGPADQLFGEIDRATRSFELRADTANNSATFMRQEMSGRIKDMTQPGVVGTMMQGEPINAGKRVVQALTGMTPERIRLRQDNINTAIAQALTAPGPQAAQNYMALARLQAAAQGGDAVAQALLAGTSVGQLPVAALAGQSAGRN